MRSRRTRSGLVSMSGMVLSSGRVSVAYARTCIPGQPDTSRERSTNPVIGPAMPIGRPLRVDRGASESFIRTSRSASSTSSRSLVQLRELDPVGGVHRADAERALHQSVGGVAVEVEEPDRLRRRQVGVGDEVAERDAFEQPQPGQEPQDVGRHDAVGRDAVLDAAVRSAIARWSHHLRSAVFAAW